MKNISKVLAVLLLIVMMVTFVGCTPYVEEAGVYECYEIKIGGSNAMYQFDYYRIILYADGTCIVWSKGVKQEGFYRAKATFSIRNNKIKIVSKQGFTRATEIYDYIDGEIIMNATVGSTTVYAKFARITAE